MKNLFFCLLLLVFFSCDKSTTTKDEEPNPNSALLNEAIIRTGFDLLTDVSYEENVNSLISPLSIHTALSMTIQGADGETFSEMQSLLHLQNMNASGIAESYNSVLENLVSTNSATSMNVSNGLLFDPMRINMYEDFKQVLNDNFNTEEKAIDFNSSNAVNEINQWASDATNERIKKVIDKIKDDEILFIINALYFLGDWDLGFLPESTRKLDFNNIDFSTKEIDIMTSDEYRNHYSGEDYQAVDIDFKGNEYAMTFVLPNSTPQAFIKEYGKTTLFDWYNTMLTEDLKYDRVMMHLPKFEISSKYNLSETLKGLGMKSAFDNADLTKMGTSPFGPLFVSRVLHDAFIKVDEKGVEGAAVTTVGIGADSAPPFINFNRPFLFILRHKESKIPVFIGSMNKF